MLFAAILADLWSDKQESYSAKQESYSAKKEGYRTYSILIDLIVLLTYNAFRSKK
jgi:hypothetical protein